MSEVALDLTLCLINDLHLCQRTDRELSANGHCAPPVLQTLRVPGYPLRLHCIKHLNRRCKITRPTHSTMAHTNFGSLLTSGQLASWLGSHYLLLAAPLAITFLVLCLKSKSTALSPPAVPGHWFYFNQKLIGAPWRAMLIAQKYAPIYGDIIQLSEPFKKRVILNSLDVVHELMEKHSAVTSDRPQSVMLSELVGIGPSLPFRNHDEIHKKLRRVIASGLHPAAARSYAELHTSTSAYFLNDIRTRINVGEASEATPVNDGQSEALTASIQDSVGRFILRMTFGHVAIKDDPLLERTNNLILFIISNFARHFWVDDFPILRYIPSWFPGAGFKRLANQFVEMRAQNMAESFEPVLKNALQGAVQLPSYTSNLIEAKGGPSISKEDIELARLTSTAMFAAGSTTTTALINSFIFAMGIRPDIAAKVRAEIDAQVGRDRIPTLHDRELLPYTEAALQEVIRFYPVFPLGLEHYASEDIQVRGYTIKKGTIIEANIWALMRDPNMYPDPNTFDPDRFLKSTPDTDPRRFLFGFGRRVCPGLHVANNSAFTMCAAFMSVFDIVVSEETAKQVENLKEEPWKMFAPYGPLSPKPFGCKIHPRDDAAIVVLETCKETAVIA